MWFGDLSYPAFYLTDFFFWVSFLLISTFRKCCHVKGIKILKLWCKMVLKSRWTVYLCYFLNLFHVWTMVVAVIYSISYATQDMTLMLFLWRDVLCTHSPISVCFNSFATNNAAKLIFHDFQALLRKGDATSALYWSPDLPCKQSDFPQATMLPGSPKQPMCRD